LVKFRENRPENLSSIKREIFLLQLGVFLTFQFGFSYVHTLHEVIMCSPIGDNGNDCEYITQVHRRCNEIAKSVTNTSKHGIGFAATSFCVVTRTGKKPAKVIQYFHKLRARLVDYLFFI